MPHIRVLPRHLVNKIAAGEVIERPASVVKELLENALDAGATRIEVEVEDGGRRTIVVRDNGSGIAPEDLALVFASHATSKIAQEDDLYHVETMGFRGEALASIAAVSHASVVSRRAEDDSAGEVRAEGETIHPVRPAAAPVGTTVTVRDLFFNTPARRKFLRAANTEFAHVVEQLARPALAHPELAFSLTHNGRPTHRLAPAERLRQRVADFFGEELAAGLIEFASQEEDVRIGGLLAHPSAARASGRWQYFFVNGRFVRDRFLAHALREAYRGMVDPSRSPVAFVFLQMDPSLVDVNVHPAKVEVRFRNGQHVHSAVLGAVRESLNRADLARVPAGAAPAAGEDEMVLDPRRQSLKQALAEFFKSNPPPQRRLGFPEVAARPAGTGTLEFRGAAFPAAGLAPPREGPAPPEERPLEPDRAGAPRAIQVHDSYIVCPVPGGLAIIDQHALHERIIFEELTRRVASGNLTGQRLLIPQVVEVRSSDKAALADAAEMLARVGIEVTEFGPTSVAVQTFPALLAERKVPVAEFIRDLLDLLAEQVSADPEGLTRQVLSAMACKAAVKAGDRLSDEEISALLSRGAAETGCCPHGRPTTLTLTLEELDKQFQRT